MFDPYLSRWNLIPDGSPIVTRSGRLLPVRRRGEPAMLKLATEEEERFGGVLMEWWDGDGAARVLARDNDALLLERAEGAASPKLVPLPRWFRELEAAATTHSGILVRCAETARALLAEPLEVGVLHGDLHHGNVLDFGVRGKRQRATSPETSPSASD